MVIPLGSKFILALREDEERRIRIMNDLERRVKRLGLIMLNEAENKIASLKDEQAGSAEAERINAMLPIEEIINKRANAAHTVGVH